MIIRKYKIEDCNAVAKLFYETVHTVNARDYTSEQLFAWAQNKDSLKARYTDLLSQKTLIAATDNKIIGFGSTDSKGLLDLLFIHKDYSRQGIATALCNELENDFTSIKTFVSITAKPFFEKRGYTVIKEQEVERYGVKLKNFEMSKLR